MKRAAGRVVRALVRLVLCVDVNALGGVCFRRRGHRGKHVGTVGRYRAEWEYEEVGGER